MISDSSRDKGSVGNVFRTAWQKLTSSGNIPLPVVAPIVPANPAVAEALTEARNLRRNDLGGYAEQLEYAARLCKGICQRGQTEDAPIRARASELLLHATKRVSLAAKRGPTFVGGSHTSRSKLTQAIRLLEACPSHGELCPAQEEIKIWFEATDHFLETPLKDKGVILHKAPDTKRVDPIRR